MKRERRVKGRGRQTESIMVGVSDVDEEAAVSDH